MAEDIHQQYRERLVQASQQDLVAFVGELKAEGLTQRQIFDLLESYRYELAQQGRVNEENYLIDISDRVSGNCASHLQLFDTVLSRKQ